MKNAEAPSRKQANYARIKTAQGTKEVWISTPQT
jgi:hypothetical protein